MKFWAQIQKLTFSLCLFSPILESISFELLILDVMAVLKPLLHFRLLVGLLFKFALYFIFPRDPTTISYVCFLLIWNWVRFFLFSRPMLFRCWHAHIGRLATESSHKSWRCSGMRRLRLARCLVWFIFFAGWWTSFILPFFLCSLRIISVIWWVCFVGSLWLDEAILNWFRARMWLVLLLFSLFKHCFQLK